MPRHCFLLIGPSSFRGNRERKKGQIARIGMENRHLCLRLCFYLPCRTLRTPRSHFLAFSRFSLPVIALLALAGAQLAAESGIEKKWRWLPWILGTFILLSAIANGLMTIRFTSGQWVA